MKKVVLVVFALCYTVSDIYAQCAQCTPVDCSSIKPTGGLCNQLPDDTAGQVYDEVISFYMPHTLSDPITLGQCGGCSSVTLRRIDIVGIQGLPPGLSYTASQNGSYNVQGGDTIGCVRFCGTPVAPGTYYIIVNLLADVTANGVPIIGSVNADDQAQSYRDTIVIYPGVSDCPGTFTIGNGPCVTKACDSVSVNLDATLTNTICPSLISYSWSYGNGQSSGIKTPGIVNYNIPDTFPLTLITTYYTYRIRTVTVNISGGFAGDIEEATTLQNPDPYIRINSLAFNGRGSGNDQDSYTYNNLNLVIPGGNCADPIEIQTWDEDTGPPQGTNPFGSQDDLINTHNITPSVPNQVVSAMNNSSIFVTFDTVAESSITETVDIVVFPHPPLPQIVLDKDSVCSGDSTLAEITPVLSGYLYTWVQNDTIELLDADSSVYIKVPGSYYVRITNLETGCTETSPRVDFAVGQAAPASVNIIFNGTSAFVSPFPASGFSVDWFYNGNLVVGQNGKFRPYLGDGLYEAQLYNTGFPFCRTTANPKDVVLGMEDVSGSAITDFNIFPNPSSGKFSIAFTSVYGQDVQLRILNGLSQVVQEKKLGNIAGEFTEEIDMSELSKGVYIVSVETAHGVLNRKIIVQ